MVSLAGSWAARKFAMFLQINTSSERAARGASPVTSDPTTQNAGDDRRPSSGLEDSRGRRSEVKGWSSPDWIAGHSKFGRSRKEEFAVKGAS